MKTNILLDIDGVLANFYHGFGDFLNKNYDAKLDLSVEPNSYVFEEWSKELAGQNMDRASSDWIMSGGYQRLPVYSGAQEFVRELNRLTNVHVVTARIGDFKQKFGEDVVQKIKDDTYLWFKENSIPVAEITFEHKKVDWCMANAIPMLIEDKLETVLKGAKENIHSILVNRAWNQHPERLRVYRAYNYNDILNFVRKLG